VTFDQRPYAALAGSAGLAATGWMYVPEACATGAANACRLHVVFHGCKQADRSSVTASCGAPATSSGRGQPHRPAVPAGREEPAAAQRLRLLGLVGYEGEDYATHDGRQIRAVRAMVADLLGEARTAP